jgi:hypothetical protein
MGIDIGMGMGMDMGMYCTVQFLRRLDNRGGKHKITIKECLVTATTTVTVTATVTAPVTAGADGNTDTR